jgi:glutaredoxin
MKKLFIWTKFGCPDCIEMKRMLDDVSIPYEALGSELYQGWDVAVEETGVNWVPQAEFEYPDGSIVRVWDAETLEELFEKIKTEWDK